ncbi:uncharacterized protein LOC134819994 [Bolinopsis microptera]|uniref:uncharacterized protein LOC134819994 n=1 Tax=Bolinopsis microptera TaxID=2820187 RepID=UPI003079F6A4
MKAIKNWILSMTSPNREDKETITISPRHSLGSSYDAISEYSLESLHVHADDSEASYRKILEIDAEINAIEIRKDGQIDKTGIEILYREIDTEIDVSDREIDDQYFIACDVHDFSLQESKDESTETELAYTVDLDEPKDETNAKDLERLYTKFIKVKSEKSEMLKDSKVEKEMQDLLAEIDTLLKSGQTDYREIVLQLCSNTVNIHFLPIVVTILRTWEDTNLMELEVDELVENYPLSCPTYWTNLIAYGTNLRDLKYIIEILYHLANPKISSVTQDLLKKVKTFWKDEELIHMTVKLVSKLWKIDFGHKTYILVDNNAITAVSLLLRFLFSKDPSSISIHKTLDFNPRLDTHSSLILTWLRGLFLVPCHEGKALKAIRPIVSILNYGLHQILEESSQSVDKFESDNLFNITLKLLCTLLQSSTTEQKNDLKLVVKSKIMVSLMEIFQKFPQDVIFPKVSLEAVTSESAFLQLMKCFFKRMSQFPVPKTPPEVDVMMKTMFAFFNSGLLCREDTLNVRQAIQHDNSSSYRVRLPYAEACFIIFDKMLKCEQSLKVFLEKNCEYDIEYYLLSMIEFALSNKDDPIVVCLIAKKLRDFLSDSPSSRTVKHFIPFIHCGFSHLTTTKEIDGHDTFKKVRENEKRPPASTILSSNSLTLTILKILDFVVFRGTLAQVREMELEYTVSDAIFRIIQLSNTDQIVSTALACLHSMLKVHQLNVVSSDLLIKHIPFIWKKSKESKELTKDATKVILKTGFLMLNNDSLCQLTNNFAEIFTVVNNYVRHDWQIEPRNTDALCIIWSFVRTDSHKTLIKELRSKHDTNKTEGYLAFGNIRIAKIFKYLSDIIIGYLDRNPPYNVKYLTDLTQCMVVIARASSLDEELYVLEDMVSPAMWLLEKQHDEKIVANVKEFIKILH